MAKLSRERRRVVKVPRGESLTLQSEMAATDINNIVRKYRQTGVLDHQKQFGGYYADITEYPVNYLEAVQHVERVEQMFDDLPSEIRDRFKNDPGAFVSFVGNPANFDELVRLGLARERVPQPNPAPAGAQQPHVNTPPAEPPLPLSPPEGE